MHNTVQLNILYAYIPLILSPLVVAANLIHASNYMQTCNPICARTIWRTLSTCRTWVLQNWLHWMKTVTHVFFVNWHWFYHPGNIWNSQRASNDLWEILIRVVFSTFIIFRSVFGSVACWFPQFLRRRFAQVGQPCLRKFWALAALSAWR